MALVPALLPATKTTRPSGLATVAASKPSFGPL